MKLIREGYTEQRDLEQFDFCFIDGAHTWDVDGFSFLLVDRLLRPGGWILFDDVFWTYDTSPTLHDTDFVRSLPEDEPATPQIGLVLDLLVRPSQSYDVVRIDDGWAWVQKHSTGAPSLSGNVSLDQMFRERQGIRDDLRIMARKLWTRKLRPLAGIPKVKFKRALEHGSG
jgi:hypothetical protein